MMRQETIDKVDALHERIAKLLDAEKVHHDKEHPDDNELWRHVAHTRIEMFRHCPKDRENMYVASASLVPR